jgi:hypothetical protein
MSIGKNLTILANNIQLFCGLDDDFRHAANKQKSNQYLLIAFYK